MKNPKRGTPPDSSRTASADDSACRRGKNDAPQKIHRDPLLGAAILKLSILTNRNGQGALFRSIYEGLLQDLSLTDGQVDEYLQKNWEAVRGKLGPTQ